MITLLVYFIIICLVLYGIGAIVPMPPPMNVVFKIFCAIVALVYLMYALNVLGIMHVGHLPAYRGG